MLRLETTKAAAHSLPFTPGKSLLLQAKQPTDGIATIDIFARVDPDADWAQVATWKPHEQGMCGVADFPFVKLRVTGHIEGQPLKVWCSTPKTDPVPGRHKPKPINVAAAIAGDLDDGPEENDLPTEVPVDMPYDDGPR